MDKVFCSSCGQPCPSTARFCHACGSELMLLAEPAEPARASQSDWVWAVYSLLNKHAGTRAESLVRERLAQHPRDAAAQALLGASLLDQYRVDEASDALEAARQLDAENFFVRREYACYLARMGRFGEAATETRRAMQNAPSRDAFEATRELWKTFEQRAQGNFIHQPPLPSLQWLSRLWGHLTRT